MKKALNAFINSGVKDNYQYWEIHLSRKLNIITLISIGNMILGMIFFYFIGQNIFVIDCIASIIILPFIIQINKNKNYKWAIYCFYCFSFLFFIHLNLTMGMHSYMILWYFPVIISMLQILGRKELLKHLITLSCICMFSLIAITIGFNQRIFLIELSDKTIFNIIIFNIILSFIATISFIIIIVFESMNQENRISKMFKEKEILLAEVFHRVKNNLNIVTSIINLKKNMSDSKEVQNALEDCRSRVFSMALVHQNIFNNKTIGLNFEEYIKKLVTEIAKSFGDEKEIDIKLNTEYVNLDLSNAIPCGLILNELITNSYKYALKGNNKLQIEIKLKKQNGIIEFEVKDNGQGVTKDVIDNSNTLGFELVKSLSEQINGTYSFHNDNGLVFNLKFKSEELSN